MTSRLLHSSRWKYIVLLLSVCLFIVRVTGEVALKEKTGLGVVQLSVVEIEEKLQVSIAQFNVTLTKPIEIRILTGF